MSNQQTQITKGKMSNGYAEFVVDGTIALFISILLPIIGTFLSYWLIAKISFAQALKKTLIWWGLIVAEIYLIITLLYSFSSAEMEIEQITQKVFIIFIVFAIWVFSIIALIISVARAVSRKPVTYESETITKG